MIRIAISALAIISVVSVAKSQDWQKEGITAPSSSIAECRKGFAHGNLTCSVSADEGAGATLWCHLHGRHKGYTGTSFFNAAPVVRGTNGFIYAAAPYQGVTIGGRFGYNHTDKHAYISMPIERCSGGIAKDENLEVMCVGTRTRRTGFEKLAKEMEEMLKRKLAEEATEYIEDAIREYLTSSTSSVAFASKAGPTAPAFCN